MTRARLVLCSLALGAAACAGAVSVKLPDGPWAPDPSAARSFLAAAGTCRAVRTLTAEIAVRGQAGSARIRGRVIAGFERGGALRLEAPAPFGAPVFILVSRANRATLWLPRDHQVLRDAPVEDVLDAITGLPRSSDDLLALVSGCLSASSEPSGTGLGNPRGWLMVNLADESTAYLNRDGAAWRIAAGRRDAAAGVGAWSVAYAAFSAGFPASITIRQDPAGGPPSASASITLQISQLETNVPIDARAFDVTIPPDARPITVADLRQSGPLGGRGSGR